MQLNDLRIPAELIPIGLCCIWAREQYVDPNGNYFFTTKEVISGIHLDKMVEEFNKAMREHFYHSNHIEITLHGIEIKDNKVHYFHQEPAVEFYDEVKAQYCNVELARYDADVMDKDLFFDMVSKEIADLSKMIMQHIYFKFDRVQAETWSRYLLARGSNKRNGTGLESVDVEVKLS